MQPPARHTSEYVRGRDRRTEPGRTEPRQERGPGRDELDAAVAESLGKVVRGGPNALAASKQLVSKVPQMQRAEAWEWTAELSQSLFQSEEAAEGIGAFRERRDASWVPKD